MKSTRIGKFNERIQSREDEKLPNVGQLVPTVLSELKTKDLIYIWFMFMLKSVKS